MENKNYFKEVKAHETIIVPILSKQDKFEYYFCIGVEFELGYLLAYGIGGNRFNIIQFDFEDIDLVFNVKNE